MPTAAASPPRAPAASDADGDADSDAVADDVEEPLLLTVAEEECVAVPVMVSLLDAVSLALADEDAVADEDGDAVSELDALAPILRVDVPLRDALAVTLREALRDAV